MTLFSTKTFTKSKSSSFHRLRQSLLSIAANYITALVSVDKVGQAKWTSKLNIAITYPYLTLFIFRYLFAFASLSFGTFSGYFAYDCLNDLFLQTGLLDRYLALVMSPLPLLLLHVDYLVSFTRGYRCYHLSHDLLILNVQHFGRLNPTLNSARALLPLLSASKTSEEKAKRSKLVKLKWRQLPHLGPLEHWIRVRAVAQVALNQRLLATIVVALGCFYLLVAYFFSLTTAWRRHFTPARQLATAVDGCLALYLIWRSIKIGLFLMQTLHLLFTVQLAQQLVLNRRLDRLLTCLETRLPVGEKSKKSGRGNQLAAFLSVYLQRHFQLMGDMMTMNRQLISRFLLTCLTTIFGFYVYSLSLMLLKTDRLEAVEGALVCSSFLLLSVFFLLDLRRLVAAHRTLHSPAKLLYRSVDCLSASEEGTFVVEKTSQLHLKLKLSTYYEVLTSGEEFAFSVGPVGKVTSNALLQVLVVPGSDSVILTVFLKIFLFFSLLLCT